MKRTLRVEKFSLQKAAGGGSILDAHFASGWVNFRCSFPYVPEDLTIREASELLDELKQDRSVARSTA